MAKQDWPRYDAYTRDYQATWEKADRALYRLCEAHPYHDDPAGLYANC